MKHNSLLHLLFYQHILQKEILLAFKFNFQKILCFLLVKLLLIKIMLLFFSFHFIAIKIWFNIQNFILKLASYQCDYLFQNFLPQFFIAYLLNIQSVTPLLSVLIFYQVKQKHLPPKMIIRFLDTTRKDFKMQIFPLLREELMLILLKLLVLPIYYLIQKHYSIKQTK